jgi:hypothetical protein
MMLLVVSRTEPGRYRYLNHVFGGDSVEVIFDRRVVERRQRLERVGVEQRRGDRRQRDVTKDLQAFGWALVRR